MAIKKVYLKAIDDPKGETTASGAIRKIRTWHTEFKTVEVKRGKGVAQSKVGTGDPIKVKKTPIYMGDGIYAIQEALTDTELANIRSNNVKRLIEPRFNNALDGLKGLFNAIKNPLTAPNEEQAQVILGHLSIKMQEIERALLNPSEKKRKAKTAISL